jgi:hypothetical protein
MLVRLLFIGPVFLAACSALFAFTAERAAVAALLEERGPGLPAIPASVAVLQSQPRGESTLVLVKFLQGQGPEQQECLFLYEMRRGPAGWQSDGGGGACSPTGGFQEALEISAGTQTGSDRPPLSEVDGLVRDPRIVTVEIEWDDGQVQQVPVVNGSYLAWREALSAPLVVRGLDEEGLVVFTSETPEVAPGK